MEKTIHIYYLENEQYQLGGIYDQLPTQSVIFEGFKAALKKAPRYINVFWMCFIFKYFCKKSNDKTMLTIEIEDAQLEQRIAKKAKAIGKSVQEFIKELVAENVTESDELGFEIPRLDVRQHARLIQNELTEEEEHELAKNPDVRPFAHITDAAQYVHDMRRKPRN